MTTTRSGYEVIGSRVGLARQELRPDGTPRADGGDPVMTQGHLAEVIGIHRVTLTKIETGQARVSRELLERLASALGRSREWLLGEPDQVDDLERARVKMSQALTEFSGAVDLLQERIRTAAADSETTTVA